MNISTEAPPNTITMDTLPPMMMLNPSLNSVDGRDNNVDNEETAEFNIHVSTLVICTITNVFIVLLSCYGNGKTLVTCCKTFKVHSNFRWLKTNLSAADFLLSLTQCPLLAILLFGMPMPVLAKVLVPLAIFSAGLCLTVSLNSILGIAIHRYLKMKCCYEISKKFTTIFIAYTWIAGILVATSFASLILTTPNTREHLSDVAMKDERFQTIAYVLITLFLLTLATVYFAYISIAKLLLSTPNGKHNTSPSLMKPANKPLKDKTSHFYNSIVNKHKGAFVCLGILCAHTICWLPFVCTFTFQHYFGKRSILCNINVIVWILVLVQSAINPYIYKIPKKKYFKRWYCQQCITQAKCKFHSKAPELSENAQSAKDPSGIFLIQVPENNLS